MLPGHLRRGWQWFLPMTLALVCLGLALKHSYWSSEGMASQPAVRSASLHVKRGFIDLPETDWSLPAQLLLTHAQAASSDAVAQVRHVAPDSRPKGPNCDRSPPFFA